MLVLSAVLDGEIEEDWQEDEGWRESRVPRENNLLKINRYSAPWPTWKRGESEEGYRLLI